MLKWRISAIHVGFPFFGHGNIGDRPDYPVFFSPTRVAVCSVHVSNHSRAALKDQRSIMGGKGRGKLVKGMSRPSTFTSRQGHALNMTSMTLNRRPCMAIHYLKAVQSGPYLEHGRGVASDMVGGSCWYDGCLVCGCSSYPATPAVQPIM